MTAFDFAAVQAALTSMFPTGLPVKVGTGEKDGNGETVFAHVPVFVGKLNEQTLRHTIALGLARWHGQHLNNVPADNGAKLAAFREMVAQAHEGRVPAAMLPKRVAGAAKPSGKTPDQEALLELVNARIGEIVAKLAPYVAKGAIKVAGSGKGGKLLDKDWPAVAAQVPAAAPYVKGSDWNWAALAEWVRANKAEALATRVAEITESRAAIAAIADSVDLASIEI